MWVLVRTASARRFERVPTIYVLSKHKKNIKNFQFFKLKKSLFIAWACFRNAKLKCGLSVGDYMFVETQFSFSSLIDVIVAVLNGNQLGQFTSVS